MAERTQTCTLVVEREGLWQSEVLEATQDSHPIPQAHAIIQGQRHSGGFSAGLQKIGHCVFLGV